ncbi:hypothetical protein IWX91DRAFT_405184 [Phyllosticta citricarpa]
MEIHRARPQDCVPRIGNEGLVRRRHKRDGSASLRDNSQVHALPERKLEDQEVKSINSSHSFASSSISKLSAPRRKLPWLPGHGSPLAGGSSEFSPAAVNSRSPVGGVESSVSSLGRSFSRSPPADRLRAPATEEPTSPHAFSSITYTPSVYSAAATGSEDANLSNFHARTKSSYEGLLVPAGHLDEVIEYRNLDDSGSGISLEANDSQPDIVGDAAADRIPSPFVHPVELSPSPLSPAPNQPQGAVPSPVQPAPVDPGLHRAITGLENLIQQPADTSQAGPSHPRSPQSQSSLTSKMEPLVVSSLESVPGTAASLKSSVDSGFPPPRVMSNNIQNRPSISVQPLNVRLPKPSSPVVVTPGEFYKRPSRKSVTGDWAYVKHNRAQSSPSIQSSPDSDSDLEKGRQESTHWRAWHNNTKRPHYRDDPGYVDRHYRPDTSLRQRKRVPRRNQDHSHQSEPGRRDRVVQRRREHRSEHRERYGKPQKQPRELRVAYADDGGFFGNPGALGGQSSWNFFKRHRRQPLARNWGKTKKRICAAITCINTALVGFLIGVYAGEVPRIQYVLADESHSVTWGNFGLYLGLATTTSLFWPLPLLHGRKPYTLGALAVLLPLQFPQALAIERLRGPDQAFRICLLLPRAFDGLVLGFANINAFATLLDLFGASLQSANPHQELVFVNDVRRHGGGMGLWLGIWSWCFMASIAVGFLVGAIIIGELNPAWGFYIVIIIIASVLMLNVLAPETRRARFRKSTVDIVDPRSEFVYRQVVQGEIKLHISAEGPRWWGDEVIAGVRLSFRMIFQLGFSILALYISWIYAQFVLLIVLLGALLSREYMLAPRYVGAGVAALAVGSLLAIPLTKAGLFSRERTHGPRTDSMTLETQISWTSHMTRRIIFTTCLPLSGLAYTLTSAGREKLPWAVPVAFAGVVGFLSTLACAECIGLLMEGFDTCDLQPGANSRHRLVSAPEETRRRRTNYSCFPRVTAGFFVAQTAAFILAAVATLLGGMMTRRWGAQTSTGIVSVILLALTIALTAVMWRFRKMQVIPDNAFGDSGVGVNAPHEWRDAMMAEDARARRREKRKRARSHASDGGQVSEKDDSSEDDMADVELERDDDWKPVILGNPSGKIRRMNVLELGQWSRWSEIRRLNRLLNDRGGRRDF